MTFSVINSLQTLRRKQIDRLGMMVSKFDNKLSDRISKLRFSQCEGFTVCDDLIERLMPARDLNLQLQWIRDMQIDDGDVIICAYPSSGTHLTWEILTMVMKGSASYCRDTKEVAMLEFLTPAEVTSSPFPRVFNTHCTPGLLPRSAINKKCKVVHVVRNPKDVVVSMYYHVTNRTKQLGYWPTFEEFVYGFMGANGIQHFCSYPWYLKKVETFKDEQPGYPILDVHYEDLIKNPVGEIKKIGTFLGKNLDDSLVMAIRDRCQFKNLKKASAELKDDSVLGDSTFLYRKGIVGDWKNHFARATNDTFDAWTRKEIDQDKWLFAYQ